MVQLFIEYLAPGARTFLYINKTGKLFWIDTHPPKKLVEYVFNICYSNSQLKLYCQAISNAGS